MYAYETRIVHPALERHFIRVGWKYQREVKLSHGGRRIDFLAYQTTDVVYAIECKCDCKSLGHAIYQIKRYVALMTGNGMEDYGDAMIPDKALDPLALLGRYANYVCPMIIVPKSRVTKGDIEYCKTRNVALIGFPLRQKRKAE